MEPLEIAENLTLRRMQTEMLDSVMYVERRAYDFGWKRVSFQNCIELDYESWVVEDQLPKPPVTIAHAVMCVITDQAELLNLTVDPGAQRQGLGRTLLVHMCRRARLLGAHVVTLEVRRSNYRAMNLYESMGFKKVGLRKEYYRSKGRREDAFTMTLTLPALEPKATS